MATFEIKALDVEGVVYSDTVEAVDRASLYGMIRAKGGKLISVREKHANLFAEINLWVSNFTGSVKLQEKIIFARNLSAMLSAGLALSRALAVMERQTRNVRFKKILVEIHQEIGRGGTFSGALGKYPKVFAPLFVSMVRAGEESGGLANTLQTIASQMEKSYLLIKKVRGAMIYPAIIICVMIIIGVLMMIFVVPSLTATFKELNVKLPTSTQFIISVSDFLKNHTLLFLFLVASVIGGVVAFSRTKFGKRSFDYLFPRIPIIGVIVKETIAARTARTLSSLLSAGVEVVQALSITKEVIQNSFYRAVLEEAEEGIQKGAPMSETFIKHEEVYPILVGEMMSVGEETGALADMLEKLAFFYESEVDQKTKDMSTIIEPFLMVFIGVSVGFFAVAMISPTYSLMSTI